MRETTGAKSFRIATIAILTIFTIVPIWVMVISGLKPLKDVQGAFSWWPKTLTIQPYIDMWQTVPLGNYFVNSVIVSSVATVLSLIIAIFASYAISRYNFRGRSVFSTTVLSTQMLPGVLFLLPLFLIFVNINTNFGVQLVGTRTGLIITYLTFSLPFSIWMLAGYFDGIPRELDEAAKMDGCSSFGIFGHVILPLARPAIVTTAIFSFIWTWNDFFSQLIYLNSPDHYTVPIGLRLFINAEGLSSLGPMFAMSLLSLGPVFLFFIAFQRLLVEGINTTGIKG